MLHVASIFLLAVGAPSLVAGTGSEVQCNKKLTETKIVNGHFLGRVKSNDVAWCKKECMAKPGCQALSVEATGTKTSRMCDLYGPPNENTEFISDSNFNSFLLCDLPNCDENLVRTKIVDAEEIAVVNSPDVIWCKKECMVFHECQAFSVEISKEIPKADRVCHLFKFPNMATEFVDDVDYHSFFFCDEQCGLGGNKACMTGEECEPGLTMTDDDICECGEEPWGPCCKEDDSCGNGLTCDFTNHDEGVCAPCGGLNDTPCGDGTCKDTGNERLGAITDPLSKAVQCKRCGRENNPPCTSSPPCDPWLVEMTMSSGYKQCEPCGLKNQLACADEPRCDPDRRLVPVTDQFGREECKACGLENQPICADEEPCDLTVNPMMMPMTRSDGFDYCLIGD